MSGLRPAIREYVGDDDACSKSSVAIFAASAHDGGEAVQVTHTPGPESQVAWAPGSSRIVYVSQRDAITHVFLYDFTKRAETQLTTGPKSAFSSV